MKSTAAATLVALSLAALTVTLADAAAKQESGRGRNGKLREFAIDRLFGYKMVPRLRQSSRLRVPATLLPISSYSLSLLCSVDVQHRQVPQR